MFESVTLKHTTLKNRLVMAPMTTWASQDDYSVSEEELAYYGLRNAGVGLVITGCAHVQSNGIGFTNEFSVDSDDFLPGLRALAKTIKANGAKAILQINHAGNKALPFLTDDVVSSSPVETPKTAFVDSLIPRELTDSEIVEVIKAFGQATRRAIEAGFDGVEIHGAHGFLIQNFLSPYFNKRNDRWGGSLENRMRFALELVKEIRQTIKQSGNVEFILGYRLSPDEPMEAGLKVADTLVLAERLAEAGVDYLHLSLVEAGTSKPDGFDKTYVSLFAEKVAGKLTLMTTGAIQSKAAIEQALAEGADLVGIGHTLVTDPDFVEKIATNSPVKLSISKAHVDELQLPPKMWTTIQAMGDWFTIEE
ncbi:NADH:flavin oxidoreductase [Streptococcus cuniculi]|uniref:NADH:flavin oxidoreductase n=1 Tax=Streptococcus cuniculi TaxID=1432788 RepID=A0A1Q8E8K2_9STRE|nr:NADH-dependent flavin oxidoreductase [Streptococcus cuniculi]OLF48119.1 NADH:flavin oxidoreductase [Streptococcus cuniculi]